MDHISSSVLNVERSYPTPYANSTLLPLLLLSLARQKHSPDVAQSVKKEYDYIVVGAGMAGSVVAARLSELPCVSVLLLEAGPPPPKLSDIPGIARFFWFTDIDWQFKTAPQKYTGRALVNNQLSWPGGKTLGGGSVLNGALVVRGNRKDYDEWEAMGAKGWSYEDVLPYFKKMEDNRDPENVANGYHGVGGPVTIMKPPYNPALKRAIFRATKSIGYPFVDSNARRQTGIYDHQAYLRDSQRCSTAKAYLVPADHRKNFDILPNAMVQKVVIENRRATGVLFSYKGKTYQVRARREVIMSAGAIQTAQLLMLSGIGPKEELQKFNIPVHADLPVGKNLQDHIGTVLTYTISPTIPNLVIKLSDPSNIQRYIDNRTGPLSSTEGVLSIAFLRNDETISKKDVPNYELFLAESSFALIRDQVNLRREVFERAYARYINQSAFFCATSQVDPKSRGSVTLQSANPNDPPIIDPNYLEDPRDIEDLVQAMKTCTRIGNHPAMKKVGARQTETLFPGCEKYASDEDEYFRCQIRSLVITYSHPCGTAKMGNPRDPTTVVDPKLRVKSIKGLRVVDNSIMPKIIRGNTGGAATMIGEKASDIIKETIQCVKHKPVYSYDDSEHYPKYPHDDYEHYPKYPHDDYQHNPKYPKDDYQHHPKYPQDDYQHHPKYPHFEQHYEHNPVPSDSKLPEENYEEEEEDIIAPEEYDDYDYKSIKLPSQPKKHNFGDHAPHFDSENPFDGDFFNTKSKLLPLRIRDAHKFKLQPDLGDSSRRAMGCKACRS